jgi:hypothetical protein
MLQQAYAQIFKDDVDGLSPSSDICFLTEVVFCAETQQRSITFAVQWFFKVSSKSVLLLMQIQPQKDKDFWGTTFFLLA